MLSSAGIGGTGTGSETGWGGLGGAGGGLSAPLVSGGGIGRATGGFALPLQAATTIVSRMTRTTSAFACRLIQPLGTKPLEQDCRKPSLLRPMRHRVVAFFGQLPQISTVAINRE